MRRLLIIAVCACGVYLPLRAHAADVLMTRAHHSRGVVMMIGGMQGTGESVAATAHAVPRAVIPAPDTADGRQSIVIQPGSPSLTDAIRQTSASVAARVMALSPVIDEAADVADIDSALLMAVIDVESAGNPQAVSPKGATGLMQLMPGTGARHGASDLFDARQNVTAGARYLKELMRQFGDLSLVLAAYNAGEGAVQKYGGQIPPYAETMSYVPKVLARYRWYRAMASSTGTASASAEEAPDRANGRFILVSSRAKN